MKKFIICLLLFTLVFSVSVVPCFALSSSELGLPSYETTINTIKEADGGENFIVGENAVIYHDGGNPMLYVFSSDVYSVGTNITSNKKTGVSWYYKSFSINDKSEWELNYTGTNSIYLLSKYVVWTLKDIDEVLENDNTFFTDYVPDVEEEEPTEDGSLLDGIKGVWQSIINLPSRIASALSSAFDSVVNVLTSLKNTLVGWLSDIWDSIKSLPKSILDGIKDIFVPDSGYIDTAFNSFINDIKAKFNIDTSAFENLFTSEKPVEDVYIDYEINGIGKKKFKVLDTSFLKQGVEFFRPIIRGFIVLMLLFYNIRQLIGFFGYDAGVVAGRTEHIKSSKESQGD